MNNNVVNKHQLLRAIGLNPVGFEAISAIAVGGNLDQHSYNAAAGGRPKLKDLLLGLADGTVDIITMLERGAGTAAAKTANAKTCGWVMCSAHRTALKGETRRRTAQRVAGCSGRSYDPTLWHRQTDL